MRRPVFLRRMELVGIRLDLCKFYSMNRKYFTNEQIENFELVYDIQLEDFLEKFELKLDNIKSLEQFKQVLLEIKDIYIIIKRDLWNEILKLNSTNLFL